MNKISKAENYLIRLLVILKANKETMHSVCVLLTDKGKVELIEKLIEMKQANQTITNEIILETATKIAGLI